ncbi:uncharacterized protein JN550_008763 [Neoarthrinium moseri]|uniref:uncharacterized protein n=1 Tax=Neoarthrinium moseri TaxID=1658444 RepID=UPI001FDC304D|nr:uncharacterized protein JN550_008763 [Neoarthrinium moseri]KAI1864476.1 hypothetical protein JN550_008763 [Neoarthrinium moseri]
MDRDKEQPTSDVTGGVLSTNWTRDEPIEPYSIYSRNEKWFIVGIVAVAGFYRHVAPLPANIYFPAIPMMSKAFETSEEVINQTVTAYLIMQGASPMLWGPLSDRFGRRPVFLACLSILIGSCVGLALCPTNAFWLLIVLRLLQAGGCASTIALGAGVTGDIATPEERGGYFGLFNLGPMLAPCIGPAVGGALAESLGWRAIFWALTIMAVTCMIVIYVIMATISSAFSDVYPWLSESLLGVSYLPTGTGMIIGTQVTGRLLDSEYTRIKRTHAGGPFPKEYARLRTMPFHLAIFVLTVVGWGFSLGKAVHIAVPLVMSAILGWCGMAILNTTMTLMIDILQSRSSGATACTNLVRCWLGAIVVATTDRMVNKLGYIWTYVLLAGISACMLPLMYVEMKLGPAWRIRRDELDDDLK